MYRLHIMAGRALTAKQEAFALHYAEHGVAAEALRHAYKTPSTTKPETVWRSAQKLLDNPKVMARVESIRKPAADAVGITLKSHLEELELLRELAKQEMNLSAAIQAEHHRGKASGIYVDKIKLNANLNINDLINELRK